MNPNREMMQAYGNEVIKTSSSASRLAYGAMLFGAGRYNHAQAQEQRMQAQMLNEIARQTELQMLGQATSGARYTRPPIFVAPNMPRNMRSMPGMGMDSDLPVGMDAGMVRLASVAAGAGTDLAKQAGIGDMLMGFGKGVKGLGKGVASGLGGMAANTARGVAAVPGRVGGAMASGVRSVGAAGTGAVSQMGQGLTGFGQKMQTSLTGMGQRAQSSLSGAGARAQSALSGQPNMQAIMSRGPHLAPGSLAPPNPQSFAQAAPKPSAAAYRQAPPAGATQPQLAAPSAPAAAPAGGVPKAAPAAAQAGGGTLQRLGQELGNGQWKTKLPMLAAGAVGTYGAYKGLKAGLNYLSHESSPYSFNQGGPQLAYGVNQYGYPQAGTPV